MQPSTNNHVYIVRIWREHERGAWRAVVQCVADQSRTGFADLELLTVYLCQMIDGIDADGAGPKTEAGGRAADEVDE